MTRRERLEAKVEKREGWAEGRESRAHAVLKEGERFHGDTAFNTQPGHIPFRAKLIAREDRAFESLQVAEHHRQKAEGLQTQLDRSVFSDDEDALEKLEARIATRETEAERCKAINKTYRKMAGDKSARLAELVQTETITQEEAISILQTMSLCLWVKDPYPPYHITNLRASIRKDRERIAEIQRQETQAQKAESAGGLIIERYPENNWVRLTFSEKPEKEILNALRSVGFRWGGGSWQGRLDALPTCIEQGSKE